MNLPQAKTAPVSAFLFRMLVWMGACGGLPFAVFAAETNSPCARAEADFLAARSALVLTPNSVSNAWKLGLTAFFWADCATNDHQRASVAGEAIRACREAVARDPKSAPAHYYLAQNLGQLARTKSLGALKLVREMEKVWLKAKVLYERFDFAGPDRSLGLLYLEAPGWPTSIGSNTKARVHLEQAVQLAPNYPDNRLTLAEALLRWRKHEEFASQLKALEEHWLRAKAKHSGPEWEAAWLDWETRLAALKHKSK